MYCYRYELNIMLTYLCRRVGLKLAVQWILKYVQLHVVQTKIYLRLCIEALKSAILVYHTSVWLSDMHSLAWVHVQGA